MIRALKDYVLVEEVQENKEKVSESGIVLKVSNDDTKGLIKSKVIGVGKDVVEVKEGDTVLYMPRTGIPMVQDGCNWRFIKEDSLIAIVNE